MKSSSSSISSLVCDPVESLYSEPMLESDDESEVSVEESEPDEMEWAEETDADDDRLESPV
jgi:hypothetical protein